MKNSFDIEILNAFSVFAKKAVKKNILPPEKKTDIESLNQVYPTSDGYILLAAIKEYRKNNSFEINSRNES